MDKRIRAPTLHVGYARSNYIDYGGLDSGR